MPKVEVSLRYRSEIRSLTLLSWKIDRRKKSYIQANSVSIKTCSFEWLADPRPVVWQGTTLYTHSHVLADGAPVWVHAASASCVCVLCLPPWVCLMPARRPCCISHTEPNAINVSAHGGALWGRGHGWTGGPGSTASPAPSRTTSTACEWSDMSPSLPAVHWNVLETRKPEYFHTHVK